MKISILKRVLSVTVLMSCSFCASAQDVWINLYQSTGGVYTVQADRIKSVDFLTISAPNHSGMKTYAGTRLDFSGEHLFTYYPSQYTVASVLNGKKLKACTRYENTVYQFYEGGYIRKYNMADGTQVGDDIGPIEHIKNFDITNVCIGKLDASNSCFHIFGKDKDGNRKVRYLKFDYTAGGADINADAIPAEYKVVASNDASTDRSFVCYLDREANEYVVIAHGQDANGDAEESVTRFAVNVAEGISGELVDCSYYKNHIFFLVGSSTEEARFLVYNLNYNNVETVLNAGVYEKLYGFYIDRSNSRFVIISQDSNNEDQALWNDLYLERTKAVTDNEAQSDLYTRLNMVNGDFFQTKVRNLSCFTVSEGAKEKIPNSGTYTGQQIDLADANTLVYYEHPGFSIDGYQNGRGGEYYGGRIYSANNKGSNEHATIDVYHAYDAVWEKTITMSCLDDMEIQCVNFLDGCYVYLKMVEGVPTSVSTTIPIMIVTGYTTSGQCIARMVSVEHDDIFATYNWTGHTRDNTPNFISAWDYSKGLGWFIGEGAYHDSYVIQPVKVSGRNITPTRDEFHLPWDYPRGLFGEMQDCQYANGKIYAIIKCDGTDSNPHKIFVADPFVWKVTNIIPLSSSQDTQVSGETYTGVTGEPMMMALDKLNRRFVISTRDTSNKGKWWNVYFY